MWGWVTAEALLSHQQQVALRHPRTDRSAAKKKQKNKNKRGTDLIFRSSLKHTASLTPEQGGCWTQPTRNTTKRVNAETLQTTQITHSKHNTSSLHCKTNNSQTKQQEVWVVQHPRSVNSVDGEEADTHRDSVRCRSSALTLLRRGLDRLLYLGPYKYLLSSRRLHPWGEPRGRGWQAHRCSFRTDALTPDQAAAAASHIFTDTAAGSWRKPSAYIQCERLLRKLHDSVKTAARCVGIYGSLFRTFIDKQKDAN